MQIEVQVADKPRLRHVRAQLGITQERLAELAGLAIPTMVKAEAGGSIRLLSAQAILDALNALRAERDLPALGFSDIEWTVQGE